MASKERYQALMLLGAAGDALGYKDGDWESCRSGERIHEELKELGGLKNINVKLPNWPISDDTVMHLATAEALVIQGKSEDKDRLYRKMAEEYILSIDDMMKNNRAYGETCVNSCKILRPAVEHGYRIPFNERGGGCGASMRAACIGLRYRRPEELDELIAVGIESGRMTHNCPTGYLGSLTAALFTSYALQGKPIHSWGFELLSVLPKAQKYIEKIGIDVELNKKHWNYFQGSWTYYLNSRKLLDGKSEAVFPSPYDVRAREKVYERWSYHGWAGASGHDSVIIAYDALLGAQESWEELCARGMFHGGDSDSTGTIAGAWFGALYGFKSVPETNYKNIEYYDRLVCAADGLHALAYGLPSKS